MSRALIRIAVVGPAGLDLAVHPSDTGAMDPVIAALAQLVRDRYERELAGKAARWGRLRVVEAKSA
jgi:hypothetical protein